MNRTAQEQLREMNEALLVSSVHQHELADEALRAGVAARESEDRYRTLFDLSPVAVYSCDASGVIQKYNRRAVELWDREPALGDTEELFFGSFKLFRPDGSLMPHGQCPMADVLSGKISEVHDGEVLIERPDGSRITVIVNIRPLKNQDGKVTGAINCFYDISERKMAEQALHESEIRYRRLFQSAKDGILILDAQTGKIVDANAFISGMLGREPSDILGKELWEIGLFGDIEAHKAAFRELQERRYIRYDHLPIQKPNGESVEVEFVSNVYQEGDRLVAQCNVRDIVERRRMETEIQQQAMALADQHRHKDEFLAMLSHELRNPLAPIRSATHLLKLHERGSENLIQQEAREVIERQVTQLTRLVSDLLEVSRAINGQIKLRLQNVDMRQIVQHGRGTAGPVIERGRHQISLTLPGEPVWVNGDPTRLEEIVVNLLANAAKYTEDGGRIEVNLGVSESQALLRVRDSGVGIDPELLPRIFDLFSQGMRSLDRSQGGLGIGLSLVRQMVVLHGGTAEAHSEGRGKGSEFIVRLPLVRDPQLPAEPPTVADTPDVKGLRVLVVDDNVDACIMLAKLLRLRSYSVQTAHTGPAAIESALAWRPDVILLDIGLPELDGYEVARRLRANPELRNMRLVAVTGYGSEGDLRLAREAGFDAHLLKPVDLADIEKLLATSKEQQSSQPNT